MLDISDPSGLAYRASPIKPPRVRRTRADLARAHAAMVRTRAALQLRQLAVTRAAEASERAFLRRLADALAGEAS